MDVRREGRHVGDTLLKALKNIYKNNDWKDADMTIFVQGKYFSAHKLVFSLYTSYFHSSAPEFRAIHYMAPEVKPETFEQLLEFLYTGSVNCTFEQDQQLVRLGHTLGIEDLMADDVKRPSTRAQPTTVSSPPMPSRVVDSGPRDVQNSVVNNQEPPKKPFIEKKRLPNGRFLPKNYTPGQPTVKPAQNSSIPSTSKTPILQIATNRVPPIVLNKTKPFSANEPRQYSVSGQISGSVNTQFNGNGKRPEGFSTEGNGSASKRTSMPSNLNGKTVTTYPTNQRLSTPLATLPKQSNLAAPKPRNDVRKPLPVIKPAPPKPSKVIAIRPKDEMNSDDEIDTYLEKEAQKRAGSLRN